MCVNAVRRVVCVCSVCIWIWYLIARLVCARCSFFSAISHAKYNKRCAHWKSNDLVPLSFFHSFCCFASLWKKRQSDMATRALFTNRIINVYCFVLDYIIHFSFRFFPFMFTFFPLSMRASAYVCLYFSFVLSLSVQAKQKRQRKTIEEQGSGREMRYLLKFTQFPEEIRIWLS